MNSRLLPIIAWLVVLTASNTAQAQTGTVAFNLGTYTALSDQSSAAVTVSFTGNPDGTSQATFVTSNGTATAGVNYTAVNTNLEFAASATTTTITVTVSIPILGDVAPQSTQTVNLALSTPLGPIVLGSQSNAVLQIINTNAVVQPTVAFDSATYTAYDTDTVADVNVVLADGTNGPVSVTLVAPTITTNVVFTETEGVVTNLVEIPLTPPSACDSNQSLSLVLENPEGAVLSSPSTAVLMIQATGPSTIQLSAANYSVHEHAGQATVTATRCGDSSDQVTVDYATSDGTAVNGVDYFGTTGTLIFPPGASSEGFSFQIVTFSTFQSNKTVNVTLSNPVGATLGAQDTAVVTIVNDRPQTIVFTNSDGSGIVTLMLRSIGTMQVSQQEPLDLLLSGTEVSTKITMTVKSGTTNSPPQIDQITSDQLASAGDCGLIDARDFDVTGPGIQVAGYLKQLRIHDLTNGGSITSNGSANQSTSIVAHNLDDGCDIEIANRIGSLQAARFGNGASLTAEQIGSFSINGDKKNGLSGDCLGSIEVFGDNLNSNQVACGSIKVAGAINNATITIDNGSAGAVTASQIIDSTIYLGYTPNDPSSPISSGGAFVAGLRLDSVNSRSSAGSFVASYVAAAQIGGVHLASIETNNGGIPFGVTAQEVSGASCKEPPFHFAPHGFSDQSLGDFHVLVQ